MKQQQVQRMRRRTQNAAQDAPTVNRKIARLWFGG